MEIRRRTLDVTVAIVGTNFSDAGLADQDAEQFEIEILDKITHFVTAGYLFHARQIRRSRQGNQQGADGPGWHVLGWHRRGPCRNRLAFVDGYTFTGEGLRQLGFGPAASSETAACPV